MVLLSRSFEAWIFEPEPEADSSSHLASQWSYVFFALTQLGGAAKKVRVLKWQIAAILRYFLLPGNQVLQQKIAIST